VPVIRPLLDVADELLNFCSDVQTAIGTSFCDGADVCQKKQPSGVRETLAISGEYASRCELRILCPAGDWVVVQFATLILPDFGKPPR